MAPTLGKYPNLDATSRLARVFFASGRLRIFRNPSLGFSLDPEDRRRGKGNAALLCDGLDGRR